MPVKQENTSVFPDLCLQKNPFIIADNSRDEGIEGQDL